MEPIRVAVLGSTGSIGRQTLDVIRQLPGVFRAVGLTAGSNADALADQVSLVKPTFAYSEKTSDRLRDAMSETGTRWLSPTEIATVSGIDVVMVGTAGAAGLIPTISAISAGRPVALANKEVLVMAGHLVRRALAGRDLLRPVDSEHSAIWQCLWGEDGHEIRRILLTASGGAFRDLDSAALHDVTSEQALNHPTWNMGRKITVDSATLMNKGMETIEAMWLFDVPMEKVEVVMHRESIVHSLVEFGDGSVKAQLGLPDMRLPIQCALAFPDRIAQAPADRLDLPALGTLNFGRPDIGRFPCLRLARQAGDRGGTYPAVMAAADEVAVDRFLREEIRFIDIASVVEKVMDKHDSEADPELDAVLAADGWARRFAATVRVGAAV
ncbi:MAG TPA: 1-deoxy-D-xylulose-5-phosphate reductoisomerase [Dehalococcoidia bacterium]|nr:1-deoxy-D-xylulose-5-phosphate reductoisomerase [Dehalococcoidia bacterium]